MHPKKLRTLYTRWVSETIRARRPSHDKKSWHGCVLSLHNWNGVSQAYGSGVGLMIFSALRSIKIKPI